MKENWKVIKTWRRVHVPHLPKRCKRFHFSTLARDFWITKPGHCAFTKDAKYFTYRRDNPDGHLVCSVNFFANWMTLVVFAFLCKWVKRPRTDFLVTFIVILVVFCRWKNLVFQVLTFPEASGFHLNLAERKTVKLTYMFSFIYKCISLCTPDKDDSFIIIDWAINRSWRVKQETSAEKNNKKQKTHMTGLQLVRRLIRRGQDKRQGTLLHNAERQLIVPFERQILVLWPAPIGSCSQFFSYPPQTQISMKSRKKERLVASTDMAPQMNHQKSQISMSTRLGFSKNTPFYKRKLQIKNTGLTMCCLNRFSCWTSNKSETTCSTKEFER